MHKLLLLPVLILFAVSSTAQNRTEIKGTITDSLSKGPLELATAAVLNARDTTASSLISYAQSTKEGTFSIRNLPVGIPLKIVISYVGYKPYIKFFTLAKGQLLNMAMVQLNPRQLNEVVVQAERMPIVVHRDTIEFDAGAFKVRPNAVVEDLLKKLPGVEVDYDGKITVMGKNVGKVLVDGREFFPSDLRMATKNLDADLIAKVQVYDDRENDPDHLIPDKDVGKIINLKFKKELKKSIFGKVYGGLGTQDHYQTGGLINMFRDTLQVSLLGLTNNLNNTGFDFQDLYSNGGLNRGGDALRGVANFGGFSGPGVRGRQTTTLGGININTDYGKKFKLNIAYLYKHSKTLNNALSNTQQFLADTTTTTNSTSSSTNYSDSHNVTATLTIRPNDATQLIYSPGLNIVNNNSSNINSGSSYTNFINPINNSYNTGNSSNNSLSFQQSLNYNKQLKKKGSSISVNHNFSYNPGTGTGYDNQNFTSFTSLPSYVYRQESNTVNRNTNGSVALGYHTTFSKKLTADASINEQYSDAVDKASTYDYNPVTGQYDSFLLMKSNDLMRKNFTQSVNAGFTLNLPKGFSITARISPQLQEVTNIFNRNLPDLKNTYFNLLPNASVNYKNLSISYSQNVQLPNIGDLIPYTVVFSPLYSVTGNPNLKATLRDNYSISYRKYNFQSGTNFSVGGGFSTEENSIFRQRTQNSDLVETSTPINRNGRYNYNFNSFFSKSLKFPREKNINLSFNTNLNFNSNHDFFVLNHMDGYQNSYRTSLSQQISFNYKDIIELDPQYSLSNVYTTYTGVSYNNQSNLTHTINTRYTFFLPKSFNIDGNYTYNYNPQVAPGFQKSSNLLNVAIAHQFMKKGRAEIKLSCYDILNQSISTTRYISFNSIYDNQSEIVKRYFMLTLLFKFNKSTVKEDAKKPIGGLMMPGMRIGNRF